MAKAPVRSTNLSDQAAVVNSARLLKLVNNVAKLMTAPNHLVLSISDRVEVSAEYANGAILLYDADAVVTPPRKGMRLMISYPVLVGAISNRGEVVTEIKEGQLCVRAKGYSADLNIERAPPRSTFEPMSGQDSAPLKTLLKEAKRLLEINETLTENSRMAIDVNFRWGNGRIIAAAADNFHAILVGGAIRTNNVHQVTMPLRLALKLSEIGGEFQIGETKVQAESDMGRIEMNQIDSGAPSVPLDAIIELSKAKSEWSCELNMDELLGLLGNMDSVTDRGQKALNFELIESKGKKRFKVSTEGRFGKVRGLIDIANVSGILEGNSLSVNGELFTNIALKCRGITRLQRVQGANVVRMRPVEQDNWKFMGMVNLISNSGAQNE